MDFLKWIFQASLAIALMFLGLESDPNDDHSENRDKSSSAIVLTF